MLTCKSPRKVMLVAHHLARGVLPDYASRFSRHDFTLPQLFACLVVKEQQRRSYREAEALLRDAPHWCRAIGMRRVPDHNTLCRAADLLMRRRRVGRLLDALVRLAASARMLGLSLKPLAGDSSTLERHHVSGHFAERRRRERRRRVRDRRMRGKKRDPAAALKRLPKLGVAVAAHSHLVVGAWCGTGAGCDSPHFERLLFDAWRRVPNRRFKAVWDAGYDSERNHRIARHDMGVASIIPPLAGRPTRKPPTYWRRHMKRLLRSRRSRRACGYTQRWQAETAISMLKRNLGSALRGKTADSRKRDLWLKVLTHDLMILRRRPRVETEHDVPFPRPWMSPFPPPCLPPACYVAWGFRIMRAISRMDVSARFNVDSTRYAVFRQGEWAFYVQVDKVEAEGIKLGVYFMHRDIATVLSPRWTSLQPGDGVRVPVERLNKTREHVVITFDEIDGGQAVLEFEIPDGARLEFVEERDASAAG